MLPENRTHKIQPVDAGVGWLVKKKIGEETGKKWGSDWKSKRT